MNVELERAIWAADMGPTEKLVALALAMHSDARGLCWPTKRHLAERTGLSERSVARAVRRLETLEWVTREEQRDELGRSKSNVYRIWPPARQSPLPLGSSVAVGGQGGRV